MKLHFSTLWVNMANEGRVFELPEFIYTDAGEAMRESKEDEGTYTLEDAFNRIARDIHEDS